MCSVGVPPGTGLGNTVFDLPVDQELHFAQEDQEAQSPQSLKPQSQGDRGYQGDQEDQADQADQALPINK